MVFLEGLLQGMNEFAESGESLSLIEIIMMQSFPGDSSEIDRKFNNTRYKFNTTESSYNFYDSRSHCSVLIKQVANDVFMGHTTWTSYS